MKIGVISDTHIPKKAKQIPKDIFKIFNGVNLILHAGDVLELSVLKNLEEIAYVHAVYGNNDNEEIKNILLEKKIIEIERFKIGLVHGDVGRGKSTLERAINSFKNNELDCIVFGHSHIPYNKLHDQKLLFNPGSATDKRRQLKCSIGILYINRKIKGEIIYI